MSNVLSWLAGVVFGIEVVIVVKVLNRKANAIAAWLASHLPPDDSPEHQEDGE